MQTLAKVPIVASREPEAFRRFELNGWERSTAEYHNAFGPLTRNTVDPMLDLLGVSSADRLLDVATGPGYLAGAANSRGAATTAIDFSPEMLKIAQSSVSGPRFLFGDAESLDFPDRSFDVVAMNFGILHLGRPQAAIQQAHRVLAEGGRFAFSAWETPDCALGFDVALKAISKYGSPEVTLPDGPPFFFFSNRDNARRILEASGFGNIVVKEVPLTWHLASAEALFNAFFQGTARTGGLLRAQPESNLRAIREAILADANARFKGDDGLNIPMPAVIYAAKKP